MERVWIVSEDLYSKRDAFPRYPQAEIVILPSLREFREQLAPGEKALLLSSLDNLIRAQEEFHDRLTSALLPPDSHPDRLVYSIRALIRDAKLEHDLGAADNVSWSGGAGSFDDPGIELLGASILELSAARDMASVNEAVKKVCAGMAPVLEAHVLAYPETASVREMGQYQLAMPIHFQGSLKAHIYIRFEGDPEQQALDRVGEILLNLSDAVALAVERNLMLSHAEETKAVWEASFDAVEDPVAILDQDYQVLRGNRAYSRFTETPLKMLQGKNPGFISVAELEQFPSEKASEFEVSHGGRQYRAYFDPIPQPLNSGCYVLRFHDITEERTLTEKILAKEQVSELGILVGSVAHEINNPIGGILAIGQIQLKDLDPKSPLYADMENIVQSADRCRKIIQTMLSLVRKADEEKKELGIVDCVQSALDLLGSEAKRLQVRVKFAPNSGTLKLQAVGNRNRLLQMFFHLLQQALLAIAERRKRDQFDPYLNIELIPGYQNLEIRIEDNGDPIKHEYEIQSSVAFTVSKMILEEHELGYFFSKQEGKNQQRLIFNLADGH
ncbi:MAG: histidine kinase dimerization/phospho-acceptor domain-containing protein [Bdellovibrionota bacterium]